MQVRLLGPLDVMVDGVAQPVSGLRRRAVLAVLGLSAGETVSIDRLVDVVWDGSPPAKFLNTLQSNVSYLRGLLGGRNAIVARPPGYRLQLESGDGEVTDLRVADRLIERARRTDDPAERVAVLEAALALWRGRPLVDVAGLSWLDSQAERLAQLRMDAMSSLHEARLALGEHANLVAELEALTREHPYAERLHQHLMLALYRVGRQADALAVFQQLRRRLADDLGTDPGPPTRELEAAILRQDPSLDPPAGPAVPGAVHIHDKRAVHIHDEVRAVPRQLPADLAGFVGRADHLAVLDGQLSGDGAGVTICAISGTAGVGKTTLAVHWAHRVAHLFPDGQLYVNLRGFDPTGSPMDPAEAIRGFLDAFGLPAQRIPAGLDAQAAAYRSLVARRRLLVLLDNARDADQIRPLLPGAPSCLVVVTSRDQLRGLLATGGAHPHPLDLMTRDEARELLRYRLGPARLAAEPAAVEDIIDGTSRLPLALAVVAARAATHPQLPLPSLAEQLRDIRGALQALAGGEAIVDVRAVLSWSYQQLGPDAARLFRLVGLHPGPDVTSAAAASLVALPESRVPALLAELARTNLIVEHVPGRYTFHNLLRAYARELAERTETTRQRRLAHLRMLDHYLHTACAANRLLHPMPDPTPLDEPEPGVCPEQFVDAAHASAWFLAERRVLLGVIQHAGLSGFDAHAWHLAWVVAGVVSGQGHWHDYAATGRAGLAAALRLGDPDRQAHAHRHIAGASIELGDLEEAHEHLRRALHLTAETGDETAQAHTLALHTTVWERQGEYAEALDHANRALALYRASGHRGGEATTLYRLGDAHLASGDELAAMESWRGALHIFDELGHRAADEIRAKLADRDMAAVS
jgi:DNA-binding SARP family transcriptional activator